MYSCAFEQIHLYEVISRINKAKRMLVQEHGREARNEEVAELVGLTVEKLKSVVKSAKAPGSMERPIGKDGDTTLGVRLQSKAIMFTSQPHSLICITHFHGWIGFSKTGNSRD